MRPQRRVASLWKRIGWSVACAIVLLIPNTVCAGHGARDLDTQALKRNVCDDPRAATREGRMSTSISGWFISVLKTYRIQQFTSRKVLRYFAS